MQESSSGRGSFGRASCVNNGANAESISGPDASHHSSQGLDRKVSDIHLAEIATALINWREVCTNLGIKQADEVAIEEENKTADARRFVVVLLQNESWGIVVACRHSYSMY